MLQSKKRKAADMTVADKVEKENKAKAAKDGKSSGKGAKESTKPAKPAKDPNAPKKPTTSYFAFVADKRAMWVKEHPDASTTEVAKGLGEVWHALSAEDKKPYELIVAEDKKRYEKEMASYVPPPSIAGATSKGKAKKEKDPNAPKKPMGSYFIFIGEMREEVKKDFPDLKPTEMSTKLSELWKNLDAEKKKKYENMAAEAKKKYEEALAAYKKGEGSSAKGDAEDGAEDDAQDDAEDDAQDAEEDAEEEPKEKVQKKKKVVADDDDE